MTPLALPPTRPAASAGGRWRAAHALAMGFSLDHLMLDWGVDVIDGPVGAAVTPVQALVLVVGAALYAGWARALVVAGQGSHPVVGALDKTPTHWNGVWRVPFSLKTTLRAAEC